MIPSSSGRESEGQIATSLSLSLSSSSLYRSSYQAFPPPTFHSHSGTLAFILPSVSPPSAFITPFRSPLVLPLLSVLLRHLRTLPPPSVSLSFPILFSWLDILVSATHTHTHTHTRTCTLACAHTWATPPLRASGDGIRNTPTQASHQSLVFRAHTAKHTDIKIHTGYTTQVGQRNSIRLSAPDGSEESFQLINNLASTCIKLNRCLLVIMNVLMGVWVTDPGCRRLVTPPPSTSFLFFLFSQALRLQGPS